MSRSTVPQFIKLLKNRGSSAVVYKADEATSILCPCRTPEGYRDPEFHLKWKGWIDSIAGFVGAAPNDAIKFGPTYGVSQVEYQFFLDADYNVPVAPPMSTSLAVGADIDELIVRFKLDVAPYSFVAYRQLHNLNGDPLGWNRLGVFSNLPIVNGLHQWYDTSPVALANPADPFAIPSCDAEGKVENPLWKVPVKAFVQPVQSGAVRRLTSEFLAQMFGEVQSDDHLGIFPCSWLGKDIDFTDWSMSTRDYVLYNGQKFTVVSVNLIPDPATGDPKHHWEVGLRLISP